MGCWIVIHHSKYYYLRNLERESKSCQHCLTPIYHQAICLYMNEQMDASAAMISQVLQLGVPRCSAPSCLPGILVWPVHPEHLVCCSPRAPPAVCGAVRSYMMQPGPSLCWIPCSYTVCQQEGFVGWWDSLLGDFPLPSAPTCYITPPPSPHPSATLIVYI